LNERAKAAEQRTGELQKQMAACVRWTVACGEPNALILAGDTLFAGGDGGVAAYRAADGRRAWSAPVHGRAVSLVFANGRLFVSTDTGAIHCFVGAE
jgi:outer membrane protein assembly factor BamB